MRLSVFSPEATEQLFIDLKKLYSPYLLPQQVTTQALQKLIADPNCQLFVTMFNERHLGAIRVSINEQSAHLDLLTVRDLTRRRGIGKNLLLEVEKYLIAKDVHIIKMDLAEVNKEEVEGLRLFMKACGYRITKKHCVKDIY